MTQELLDRIDDLLADAICNRQLHTTPPSLWHRFRTRLADIVEPKPRNYPA